MGSREGKEEAVEKAADPRKVEWLDVGGQPLGVTVTLKDAMADEIAPGADETPELARLRRLAKSVAGWSTLVVDGEPYTFSQERAIGLFGRYPHLADQVEEGFTKKDAA